MSAPATSTTPYKIVSDLNLPQAKDLLRRLGAVERPAYRTAARSLHWAGTLKIWVECVPSSLARYGQTYTLNLYRGCPC